MLVVFLLLIAATGLCAGRQYHVINEKKTFTEAQRYCRENYTDLATVDSMEDVEILNRTAETAGVSSVAWIGLYDDVNSWRWSLSNTSFYRPGEEEFRRWATGEPDNYRSAEYCTVMNEEGRWYDLGCKANNQAVCCDVRGQDVTFVLTHSMTWTRAQSYCREQHTDLASVRNQAENQKVQELVPAGRYVWFGLFRVSWKWSDGSSSSFRHWLSGQPDNNWGRKEDCAAVDFSSSGRWRDRNCDLKYPFICSSPAPTTSTTTQETTGAPTTSTTTQETTGAPTTSTTTQSLDSSSGSSTTPPTETTGAHTDLWMIVVVSVAIIITFIIIFNISQLALMIICFRKISSRKTIDCMRKTVSTNMELYANYPPVAADEDSTYESIDPVGRDQNQIHHTPP
ncbi:macrophage mannose receptor 1-like isoform X2 [Centropristis striata]|uniref:macrophage mannose receptor 1-like isoform X2 n=1 Tax=Centropristis striata TaxID=184440 RepID=UPI0027E05EE5|nr:macrophage mannose receptor 1-like isoform X2 [Centropristis striata]